jgi:hypothetical protein
VAEREGRREAGRKERGPRERSKQPARKQEAVSARVVVCVGVNTVVHVPAGGVAAAVSQAVTRPCQKSKGDREKQYIYMKRQAREGEREREREGAAASGTSHWRG